MPTALEEWMLYDPESETLAFRFVVNRREDFGTISTKCLQCRFGMVGSDYMAAANTFLQYAKVIRKVAAAKVRVGIEPRLDVEDFEVRNVNGRV